MFQISDTSMKGKKMQIFNGHFTVALQKIQEKIVFPNDDF